MRRAQEEEERERGVDDRAVASQPPGGGPAPTTVRPLTREEEPCTFLVPPPSGDLLEVEEHADLLQGVETVVREDVPEEDRELLRVEIPGDVSPQRAACDAGGAERPAPQVDVLTQLVA